MKIISNDYLASLSKQAVSSTRKRQHQNIHQGYRDACQRLFNAIEPGSYIHPHRHVSDPRDEMLVAIRGLMALVTFDEDGKVAQILHLRPDDGRPNTVAVVEIPSITWHTVVALKPGSVILEIKAGPFDPERPKDLAHWAPLENSPGAANYLQKLLLQINTLESK